MHVDLPREFRNRSDAGDRHRHPAFDDVRGGATGGQLHRRLRRADRRLNILLFVLAALFVISGLAFIGFYSYTKYAQLQQTPEQKAIAQAIKAIRDDPKNTSARVRLGVLYIQSGNVDAAIQQFDQVLKIARDHQEALLYAGVAYLNKENYEKSLEYFNKEIRYYKSTSMAGTNPSLEQAYYYGAVAFWKMKEYDKALDYLEKALVIKSASSDTYLLRGRIYLAKKSYDEAIASFTKALKFDPGYADAYYGLGLAYEGKGDNLQALDSYKAAVKAKSDFTEAKKAVSRLQKTAPNTK